MYLAVAAPPSSRLHNESGTTFYQSSRRHELLEAPGKGVTHQPVQDSIRVVDAMVCLRSPYTVNVFGAIPCSVRCCWDRLIIFVMELVAGGDLRTLLSNPSTHCPRSTSRGAGATDHRRYGEETVHGDLKSANQCASSVWDSAGRPRKMYVWDSYLK